MENLILSVEKWSINRGLHEGDSTKQVLKLYEESAECAAAWIRKDKDALMDGIGDTLVTLIILAQQQGWAIEECLEFSYDEIKNREGEMIDGCFVKQSDLNKNRMENEND